MPDKAGTSSNRALSNGHTTCLLVVETCIASGYGHYQSDVYTTAGGPYHPVVVWQFWGRAAEASWTETSRALFPFLLPPSIAPLFKRRRDMLLFIDLAVRYSRRPRLSSMRFENRKR